MKSLRFFNGLPLLLTLSIAAASTLSLADELESLPVFKDYTAHRASSSDPTGGNRDNVRIPPGETVVLADLDGPGCVTHIWFTHQYSARGGLRKLVLRAWFDEAETPCVEAPLGDFFGLGHAMTYAYASTPLAVGTQGGLNSFWPMPFTKRARFTITNEGRQPCNSFFYYIDYQKYAHPPPDQARFHAQYRQAMPCVPGEPYVVLESRGRGHFAGCNLSIEQREDGWWGEGDDHFFIEGETTPSLRGTGSEDYFSGAWCYHYEFAYPFFGMPFRGRFLEDGLLVEYTPDLRGEAAKEWHWPNAWKKGDLWNVYRYHLESPIPFRHSVRMELEHGFINNERRDAYSSVAYWYQDHPHSHQPPLPDWRERMPYYLRLHDRGDGFYEAEDFVDDGITSGGRLVDGSMSFWGHGAFSNDAFLEWRPRNRGDALTLLIPVPEPGRYELTATAIRTKDSGTFDIALDGQPIRTGLDPFHDSVFPEKEPLDLGTFPLEPASAALTFTYSGKDPRSEGGRLLLDTLQLKREQPPVDSEENSNSPGS